MSNCQDDWFEIDIYTSTECIDILCDKLNNFGFDGFMIKDSKDFNDFLEDKSFNWDYIDDDLMGLKNCETTVTVYIKNDETANENLSNIKSILSTLKSEQGKLDYGRLEFDIKNIKEEDWANNWRMFFKPLTIGDKLIVKPSWETLDKSETRKVIEIDPASSFGTGQHDTTQLCLENLEKYIIENDKILDLGCGSGILGIAGMCLGGSFITAVDIDKNSTKIASENLVINGFSKDKFKALCGDITTNEALRKEIGNGYDLVLANIVSDVLIVMSGYFKQFLKPDGTLIVSGIIKMREDEVKAKLLENEFEVISKLETKDWVSYVLKLNNQKMGKQVKTEELKCS